MSLKSRLDGAIQKLQEFETDIDDRSESTPRILRNMSYFIEDVLGDLISELQEIASEIESIEEEAETLKDTLEGLVCQDCSALIDGEAPGYPRCCRGMQGMKTARLAKGAAIKTILLPFYHD